MSYINVHGTRPDAAAAPGALHPVVIFIHIILELVHEPLAYPLELLVPGIVP